MGGTKEETRSILAEEAPTSDLPMGNAARNNRPRPAWKKKLAVATGSCAALAAGGVCAMYASSRSDHRTSSTSTTNLEAMVPNVAEFEARARMILGKELTLINNQELNMPPFEKLDANGDGIVTKDEYLSMLTIDKNVEMYKGQELPEAAQAYVLQKLDEEYVDQHVCLSRLFARTTNGSINREIYPMFYALDYTFCQSGPIEIPPELMQPTMVPTPIYPTSVVEPPTTENPWPQQTTMQPPGPQIETVMPMVVNDDTPMPLNTQTETTMPLVTPAPPTEYPQEQTPPVPSEAPPMFTGMPTLPPGLESITDPPLTINKDGMPLVPGQEPAPVIPFVVYNTTTSGGTNVTIAYPVIATDLTLPGFDTSQLNLTKDQLNETITQVQQVLDQTNYNGSNPLVIPNGDFFNNTVSTKDIKEITGENPNTTLSWGEDSFNSTVNSTIANQTATGGTTTPTGPYVPPVLLNGPSPTPEIVWKQFVPEPVPFIPPNATSEPSDMPYIPATPSPVTLSPPTDIPTGWKQVAGGLKQLSFDGQRVCGVNDAGSIYCSSHDQIQTGDPKWVQLKGLLSFVKVYGDTLYGVDQFQTLHRALLDNGLDNLRWEKIPVPTNVMQVSFDGKTLCVVSTDQGIYCAKSFTRAQTEPNWLHFPGSLKYVEVVNGKLLGTNANDDIFVGRLNDQDPRWVQLYGKLRQVSYDGAMLCGTNSDDYAFCATDGLQGPQPNWALVDGQKKHVVVDGGAMYATTTKGEILRKYI